MTFSASQPAFIRIASRKADQAESEFEDFSSEGISVAGLKQYVSDMASDSRTLECLAVSSPSLVQAIRKVAQGGQIGRAKLLRTAMTLARYASRMAHRPTPFGLQAGVALVSFEGGHGWPPIERGDAIKTVLPDAGWLAEVVKASMQDPELRHRATVAINNLYTIRGDRILIPNHDGPEGGQTLSIRISPILTEILGTASRPILYSDLLCTLSKNFDKPSEKIDEYLRTLIEKELLIASTSTVIQNRSTLSEHLTSVARPLSDLHRDLTRILSDMAQYSQTGNSDVAVDQWIKLTEETQRINPVPRSAPQVDLSYSRKIAVPSEAISEAENCARVLWKISGGGKYYQHLDEYRSLFQEKYGVGGQVLIEELIDPHRGLGFPRTYSSTRLEGSSHRHNMPTGFASHRLDLLCRGLMDPAREVELTERDIVRLSSDRDKQEPAGSIDFGFRLMAKSVRDVANGNFFIDASSLGSSSAGSLIGRFSDALGVSGELGNLLSRATPDGVIPAYVRFRPNSIRGLNLVPMADLTPLEIPVGVFPNRNDSENIDWRSLVIVDTDHGFKVFREGSGQEIRPVAPHSLMLRGQVPDLARFLLELRYTNPANVWSTWDWRELATSPCLPRVRIGRSVLSLLSWAPDTSLRDSVHDSEKWEESFVRWKEQGRIPDQVTIVSGDRSHQLNLAERFHREIFRDDLRKDSTIRVRERPETWGDFEWLDGQAHEIVLPMVVQRDPESQARGSKRTTLGATRQLAKPARNEKNTWIYVKLYAIKQAHDQIIADLIPRIVGDAADKIDRWFFIRYADPEDHIRLRLRQSDSAGDIWPQLMNTLTNLKEAGIIYRYSTDLYEPEFDRYGGADRMGEAEQIFCQDSQLVVAELRSQAMTGRSLSRKVQIVANYALLLESILGDKWLDWASQAFPRVDDASLTRADIQAASRLATPGRTAHGLEREFGIRGLKSMWSNNALDGGSFLGDESQSWDDIVLSLLHMQYNRLIGINKEEELTSLKLLGHVARAHLGRRISEGGQSRD
ncbi:lantibiotic dehydratase [Streptomyces sp. NPDC006475]|uniref:lantibiotic dehydratase n=1 Tax=Streptomyces sp. NPDC006475 TaxID=3155719 RepID=UPI0033BC0B13